MKADQFIIYQTPEGETAIDVKLDDETVWLKSVKVPEIEVVL